MRVLISGGGCEEAIDGVRSICNFSTGETASHLANVLYSEGHYICAVMGKRAKLPEDSNKTIRFSDYKSLEEILKNELSENSYDMVIHLAAVSDYSVEAIEIANTRYAPGSLSKISTDEAFSIILKKNPKILDSLRGWSKNSLVTVVAFKLTNGSTEEEAFAAVQEIAKKGCADFIVHNDVTQIMEKKHPVRIFAKDKKVFEGNSKDDLAFFFKEALRCF